MPNKFPNGPVKLMRTGPRLAVVMEDFRFRSETLGLITVEKGFDTDYASVPRVFWSIYPPDGSYTDAAVVHDYLYWYQAAQPGQPITRAEADAVFLEAMTALGVPWHRRHILHKAVRAGGWVPWGKRARELSE